MNSGPAAWLHMTVSSRAALSQHLSMSWVRAREGGAVGRLRLATRLKALLSLAGSGDQEETVTMSQSLFSACIPYHLDDQGGLMN